MLNFKVAGYFKKVEVVEAELSEIKRYQLINHFIFHFRRPNWLLNFT